MFRITVLSVLFLLLSFCGSANNVRITKEASIDAGDITGNVATIRLSVEWENSWRDDYNWDAVYVFLKYKKKGDLDWKPVYLKDEGHTAEKLKMSYYMAKNSATADVCQGIFVYRDTNGLGTVAADLSLKWLISQNGLTVSDFMEIGKVEYTAMCLEMVYVPKGPFALGDGVYTAADGSSSNRLKSEFRTILPEWDLIKKDGSVTFEGSGKGISKDQDRNYPPENVANRVNDPRYGVYKNAWYPSVSSPYSLTIDFKTAKTIRWFGLNTPYVANVASPSTWSLYGTNDRQVEGDLLYEGKAAEWPVNIYNSYPITRALKVKDPKPYRYYQIRSTERPMINNLSMTEKDLDALTDNLLVIDRQTPVFIHPETGISSGSGLAEGKWSAATLSANYPTGFDGFYVMKYEVSQEQYIGFLNKLQEKQKASRTVGEKLTTLTPGQYVYGTDNNVPNWRNGIVVGDKAEDNVIFANNLSAADGEMATDADGQTVACNFLSPADMMAYADWTGLRPLSELEYEKMARRPWPEKAELNQWAGGAKSELKMQSLADQIQDPGKTTERLPGANVNAGAKEQGPVRSGAVAKGADKYAAAGASFWGVMELSGNLAEIYYNVEPLGRTFHFIRESHGDGVLTANGEATAGDANLSATYWPVNPAAFMVRGGGFQTADKEGLAIADRRYATYFSEINQKDSTVTFRLGHSYAPVVAEPCTTYLKLANGRITTADNVAVDSLCAGQKYTITGSPMLLSSTASGNKTIDVPKKYKGKCAYFWFLREHEADNTHWRLLPGENGKDLTLDLKNNGDDFQTIYVKRVAVTPTFSHETSYARLCVINASHEFSRLKDTLTLGNQTKGFYVETRANASFVWRWNSAPQDDMPLQNSVTNGKWDYFFPERGYFRELAKQTHVVTCDISILNKCKSTVNLEVYVEERLNVGMASSDITPKGKGDPRGQCGVLMQDSRDGEVYGTVQIGEQCWMAENLRNARLEGLFTAQPTDPNGAKLGLLYKWDVAVRNTACPAGWRLPKNADFDAMIDYLKKNNPDPIGNALKAANYWNFYSRDFLPTNSSGFGAIGAGHNGSNTGFRTYAEFITFEGYYHELHYANATFARPGGMSTSYFSIRCIRR